MTKHLVKFILIANIGFFSCNSEKSSNIKVDNSSSELEYDSLTVLAENIGLLGELHSFSFMEKDKILVSSLNPSKVFIYSIDGKQITEIGNSGSGPYEFLEPTIVKSDKNNIYIWCRNQLKLIAYNFEGTPIKEYNGYKKAIKDFIPHNNDIYFYTSGGHNGTYIERFSLSDNKIVQDFGHTTELHKLIGTMACSGGIAANQNKLVYVSPDRLELNEIDLEDLSASIISWDDSEFQSSDIHIDAIHLMNEERNKAFDIIAENSLVTGLYNMRDLMVIKTEVGRYNFEQSETNKSTRFDKYYLINDKFEVVKTVKSKKDGEFNNCLFSSNNEGLYAISVHSGNNDFYYQLNRLKLN